MAGGLTDTSTLLDTTGYLTDTGNVLSSGENENCKTETPEEDENEEAGDFITKANTDAESGAEKRQQEMALRTIGNRYLQYLGSLDPSSTEAQALLTHSGFDSIEIIIKTFKNGSGGLKLTLQFSTHDKNSVYESAGGGQFYTHPNGYGGITGVGAMYQKNVITLSRDLFILCRYMASREYINLKAEGQPFDYDEDIEKGFNFISQILEHETCHWGADWNGPKKRPEEIFDDKNTTELQIEGIQEGEQENTWELGQHFEWAAWGKRNPVYNDYSMDELKYGAAVNIHYRLMGGFPCELNLNSDGSIIKPSPEQVEEISDSIYLLLANFYPQNVRVKENGDRDGGYSHYVPKTDTTAGYP